MSDERPQPSERHIIIYEETEIVVIRRQPEPEPPDDGELLRRLRAYNDRPCDPELSARIDREAAARDRWEFFANAASVTGMVVLGLSLSVVVALAAMGVCWFLGIK